MNIILSGLITTCLELTGTGQINLIHKKDNREVYEDGNYIIKKTAPDAFNFDRYERFQKDNPCFVKVHSFDDGVIVMDKVEGMMFNDYAKTATADNLWYICFTHRMELYKRYFDFHGKRDIHANDKLFLHADGVPGNVIVNNGQPTYIDPDGTIQLQWDMFLQKINEHHFVWQSDYTYYAHRFPATEMEKWNKSLSELGYK
tara:strand:- start:5256 stop:5858 length:603 start_codon:yes stop_codon:yes gene_type:complete